MGNAQSAAGNDSDSEEEEEDEDESSSVHAAEQSESEDAEGEEAVQGPVTSAPSSNGKGQGADASLGVREGEKQAPRGKPDWHIESAMTTADGIGRERERALILSPPRAQGPLIKVEGADGVGRTIERVLILSPPRAQVPRIAVAPPSHDKRSYNQATKGAPEGNGDRLHAQHRHEEGAGGEARGREQDPEAGTGLRQARRSGSAVVLQQEPEGSPFRRHSSQNPLEPQEHSTHRTHSTHGTHSIHGIHSTQKTHSIHSTLSTHSTHSVHGTMPPPIILQGGDEPLPAAEPALGEESASSVRSRHPHSGQGMVGPAAAEFAAGGIPAGPASGAAALKYAPRSEGVVGATKGRCQGTGVPCAGGPNAGPGLHPGTAIPSSSSHSSLGGNFLGGGGLSSFTRVSTDMSMFLAASASLSSHPFLHRPLHAPLEIVTEFYVIRHGQASHNVLPLIGGRSHDAPLTPLGKQQAHILGRFLRTYTTLRFDAIYSSPIERSMQTANIVCQELGVAAGSVQVADALQELSQGQWEQQPRQAIYKEGVLEQMTAAQPDFRAPGGESQRQVEHRMVEFVNNILFSWQHLVIGDEALWALQEEAREGRGAEAEQRGGADALERARSAHSERDVGAGQQQQHPQRQTQAVKGQSGLGSKGREAGAVANGVHQAGWEGAPQSESSAAASHAQQGEAKQVFRVALFSHGTAIRCLLRGVMSWDPHLTHKVAIDNTSVTLLKHTVSRGWHLVKLNDTAHIVMARGPLRPE